MLLCSMLPLADLEVIPAAGDARGETADFYLADDGDQGGQRLAGSFEAIAAESTIGRLSTNLLSGSSRRASVSCHVDALRRSQAASFRRERHPQRPCAAGETGPASIRLPPALNARTNDCRSRPARTQRLRPGIDHRGGATLQSRTASAS